MSSEAILKAVKGCKIQQLRILLKYGAKLTPYGILLESLMIDQPDKRKIMFRFLIRNGANYNEVDATGRDVLLWACYLGRITQVKHLLENFPGDLNLCRRDNYGSTGLHYAVELGLKDVVEELCKAMVKFNLSVDIANRDGNSPYIVAKILNRPEIMTILVNNGNASPWQIIRSYDGHKHTPTTPTYQQTHKFELDDFRINPQQSKRQTNTRRPGIVSRDKLQGAEIPPISREIPFSVVKESADELIRSHRTSKECISEFLHLLAIEESDSFTKPAKRPQSPKCVSPKHDAEEQERTLPSINVLIKMKTRVKQLTGRSVAKQQGETRRLNSR